MSWGLTHMVHAREDLHLECRKLCSMQEVHLVALQMQL